MVKDDLLQQAADHSQLKGYVFKRRLLNPSRVRGIGGFAFSWGIYSYLPYLTIYFGTTLPILAACSAGLYGMLSFSESQVVNTIKVIDQGEHYGKLDIAVAVSPFVSKHILVDIRDVKSVVPLPNDDLGVENRDGNVLLISKHIDLATGHLVSKETVLTLPGDAYRDREYIDWLISDKTGESSLVDDYQDLMH